jgi:hypothetical protein
MTLLCHSWNTSSYPVINNPQLDDLVRERIIALIVKNSLNNQLRDHLMTSYSTTKGDCYPKTINDALSLLSTFAKQNKDTSTEEAVVSFHETATDTDHKEDTTYDPVIEEIEYEDDDDNTIIDNDDEVNVKDTNTVEDTLFFLKNRKRAKTEINEEFTVLILRRIYVEIF